MMKFLFIDDYKPYLDSLRYYFFDDERVCFIRCTNLDEAVEAIKKHKPNVLFLDNHLSPGGNEGFEIIEKIDLNLIKVYTTTGDCFAQDQFRKQGIEAIEKDDLNRIHAIIVSANEKIDIPSIVHCNM